ncbi:MAG: Dot/Icm secretion system protein IcmQ [Gammaproteobacteria bacterium]|nr:Dot/Icm secretion system protein IcmQ [Gammaproteobacteria bacterium]
MMKQFLSEQQEKEITQILDEAADSPVWQKSNFLRVMGKQLHQVRDTFKNMIGQAANAANTTAVTTKASDDKQVELFIYLYSTKGLDMTTWEHILVNLPSQLVSRPIYTDEKNIKTWIRSKPTPNNEAYIRVTVSERFIMTLPDGKGPVDRLKQPLITIRGFPLDSNYKATFVHITGEYEYFHGHLTKK